MWDGLLFVLVCIGVLLVTGTVWAASEEPDPTAVAHWLAVSEGTPGVSFVYGGKSSAELLPSWSIERAQRDIDESRKECTVQATDPATGLAVRTDGVVYHDFPVVEWTVHFKNTGPSDTPIIESIQVIDAVFTREGEFVLHHIKGDNCTPDSYEPLVTPLPASAEVSLANTGGRPTQIGFPYYNIASAGGGLIVVLGWPGQWNMQFTRDEGQGLRVRGGQERTHFVLHPGEEVRGPRVVVLEYEGDWIHGQNLWRAWMRAHNMPKPGGKPLEPMASLCNGNYYPGIMTNAAQEIAFIQQHLDAGVPFTFWWEDAGWYPCDGVTWPKTGTWEIDAGRFPKGIREVSDYARERGVKTIVWFEPERVHPDTWLTENHPEWILGGKDGGLLHLGHPEALEWVTGHVGRMIEEQGIDVYRQDFNMDPLGYWRANDTEDRQGITEIRHVEGYLAYWDALLARFPNLFIDSCASGGRRNDIETLRRAVPLLRSDWYAGAAGQQCHTYGLSLWVPFQGTGFIYQKGDMKDEYWGRSMMVAEYTFGPGPGGIEGEDLSLVKRMVEEAREIAGYTLGDFHPLTPYTLAEDQWMAWQFDRPDLAGGVVQVFRREKSAYESARFPLRGLDRDARYTIRDFDRPDTFEMTGAELTDGGLAVILPGCPKAAILVYTRCRE